MSYTAHLADEYSPHDTEVYPCMQSPDPTAQLLERRAVRVERDVAGEESRHVGRETAGGCHYVDAESPQ